MNTPESSPAAPEPQPVSAPAPDFLNWAWNHKVMMIPIVLALVLSICGGLVGLMYISALNALRSNPLHQKTVQIAQQDERVVQELGEPIFGGLIQKGEVQVDDDQQHGHADCEIPISGPKGAGRLLVKARLVEGEWIIDQLTASLDSGKVLTLDPTTLPPTDPAEPTEEASAPTEQE